MWSGWFEQADIYLGRELAMLRRRGASTKVLEHPATWSLQRSLAGISEHLPGAQGSSTLHTKKKLRLNITLGFSLCEPVACAVPQGVQGFGEMQQLAQAAVSSAVDAPNMRAAIDPFEPGIVAGVGEWLLKDLDSWADGYGASIHSVQPLWSVATQCALVRKTKIAGLALIEPDGVACIASVLNANAVSVHMAAGMPPQKPDAYQSQAMAHIRRWKIGNDLQDAALQILTFDAKAKTQIKGMPNLWAGHWSLP